MNKKCNSAYYEAKGRRAFATTDMQLAAQAYWQAAQNDQTLREQLEHLSSYFFCLHYLPQVKDEEIAQQLCLYDKLLDNTERTDVQLPKDKHHHSTGSKIRVGYISADFGSHVMADFVSQFFYNYDRSRFQVYAYSIGEDVCDEEKLILSPIEDWKHLTEMSPAEVAEIIAKDKIDILVDLCGHTHGGITLMTMSYHPATIQLSGLGWINTTGHSSIDYFITDEHCVPYGDRAEQDFCEQLLRLPVCHLCYSPLNNCINYGNTNKSNSININSNNSNDSNRIQCTKDTVDNDNSQNEKDSGKVTTDIVEIETVPDNCGTLFGAFSNFDKINDKLLLVWKQILDSLPNCHLILKDTTTLKSRADALKNRLHKLGMPLDRINVEIASKDYLMEYQYIDIVLDTFPYTGGATVCEALSQGRPVISLYGTRHGARIGSSILAAVGLKELIVTDEHEYIEKAINLANDRKQLNAYHKELANRLRQSSVMDGTKYMRELEKLYLSLEPLL